VEQIDSFAAKAVDKILDFDLSSLLGLGQDIKILIKKIPAIKTEQIKSFLHKGIYIVRENISELIIYLDIEELGTFVKARHDPAYFNHKNIKPDSNISISNDGKNLIIRTEFVIDNISQTRLAQGPLKNVLTIRQMNEGLVRGLALGCRFYKELNSGKTLHDLEKETGQNHRTIDKYINLVYLSPNIIGNIFNNINPKNFRLKELKTLAYTHVNFKDQEREWGHVYN
jgi:hypothetical protein